MIAALYAGLLGLMCIPLSLHVIRGRRQFSVALGDSGHHEMQRRIRAQANFLEYTPLFLILLGFAEFAGLAPYAAHGFGILFVSGRVMHAYSLLRHEKYRDGRITDFPRWRIRGMVCTFTCIGLLSLYLVIKNMQAL